MLVRLGGFLEASDRRHRSGEERPALRVIGALAHLAREGVDQRDDLRVIGGTRRVRGHARVGRRRHSDREIGAEGECGKSHADDRRGDPRALRRGGPRRGRRREIVACAIDELGERLRARILGKDPVGDVGLELAALRAQHL